MATQGEFGLRPSASAEHLIEVTTPAPPAHPKGSYAMQMDSNGTLKPMDIDDAETPRTANRTSRRNAVYATSSMLLLTLQGTVLSIVLRYSRIKRGRKYLPSVAVFFSESIKLCICLTVQFVWRPKSPPPAPSLDGSSPLTATPAQRLAIAFREALPMSVPAVMFAFQQVLLIAAATHLDAVTYQIFNQAFKLVPTALFAQWLLGQRLDGMQWASMPVLAAGVILVTVNNGPVNEPKHKPVTQANWMIGMVSCIISGLSSAFAGVYFEKYVKGKHAPNLWVRNIQLSAFGVPFSGGLAWLKDGATIRKHGWLAGFSASTWTVVGLQVFGGLVTGMVVKYCDNVVKNFAIAVSVILTVLVAIPLFGQHPSLFFLAGVGLVLLSVFMYGKSFEVNVEKVRRWVAATLQNPHRRSFFLLGLGTMLVGLGMSGAGALLRWQAGGVAAVAAEASSVQ